MYNYYTKSPLFEPTYNQNYIRKQVNPNHKYIIFIRDCFRCVNCNSKLDLEIDHIVPVSASGLNDINNYATLCAKCNSVKGVEHPIKLYYEKEKRLNLILVNKVIDSEFIKSLNISKNGELLSVTDLVKNGDIWRAKNGLSRFVLSEYFRKKTTIEFIKDLEDKFDTVIVSKKDKDGHIWVNPFLFVDVAISISPKLKLEIYEWLFKKALNIDCYGDSYKRMCGALWENCNNKSEFPMFISKVANHIREECGVDDWQSASEDQLLLRDKIQDNVSILTDIVQDNEKVIDISIAKARKLLGG